MRRAAGLLIVVLLAACVPQKSKKGSAAAGKPGVRPAAASVNPAQKKAYDQGVKHFGEERYAEARASWREAVKLGPSTPLGRKAQENLQKVDSILSSLRELEKQ